MDSNTLASWYDVIVVGGGMGGLTSAALLAKAGKKVLVVEQGERPGGYARTIIHGPYTFDTAVHLIMGCAPSSPLGQGLIDATLNHLGIRDRCEFVRADPFYRVQFPGFELDVPTGREAFLQAHIEHFPDERQGLTDLADLCLEIYRQTVQFPIDPRAWDWLLMPVRSPGIFRSANSSVSKVIDRYLSDPLLKAAYCALWPYLALPPTRASFLFWATMMASYIEEGAFYCLGSFQRLPDAMATALELHGGELLLNNRVKHIRTEDRSVRGVTLENGETINAPIVVSNVDARLTFGDLLEGSQLPNSFMHRLRRMEPSISVFTLFLATDLDISLPDETMIYTSWDHDQLFDAGTPDKPAMLNVTIPTMIDRSLAPAGEHILAISSNLPSRLGEPSADMRARFSAAMLEAAEGIIPGLGDHVTCVAGVPDEEDEQSHPYPLHYLGPIYGWATSPQQTGARRLANSTPISGLYLAGHWTRPGYSIWGVVASGITTARLILGKMTSAGVLPLHL